MITSTEQTININKSIISTSSIDKKLIMQTLAREVTMNILTNVVKPFSIFSLAIVGTIGFMVMPYADAGYMEPIAMTIGGMVAISAALAILAIVKWIK